MAADVLNMVPRRARCSLGVLVSSPLPGGLPAGRINRGCFLVCVLFDDGCPIWGTGLFCTGVRFGCIIIDNNDFAREPIAVKFLPIRSVRTTPPLGRLIMHVTSCVVGVLLRILSGSGVQQIFTLSLVLRLVGMRWRMGRLLGYAIRRRRVEVLRRIEGWQSSRCWGRAGLCNRGSGRRS